MENALHTDYTLVAALARCERDLQRAGYEVVGGFVLMSLGIAAIPAGAFAWLTAIFSAGTCGVDCGVGIGVSGALALAAIIGGIAIATVGNRAKRVLLPRRQRLRIDLGPSSSTSARVACGPGPLSFACSGRF